MPNYRRFWSPGGTFFFTVNLTRGRRDLLTRHVALLRAAVAQTRKERPFEINAMVVLPDHLHAVWTLPEGDTDFSVRWGAIKGRFSMSLRRAGLAPPVASRSVRGGVNPALRKGQVGIWQERFWEHCIRDEADYRAHVRYCWINPVKHGFVERPIDWPHSSIHRDMRRGLVDAEFGGVDPDTEFGE